jgi:hypothetical protein
VPGYDPADVPLYEDRATVEQEYRRAERESRPFFAVEAYDEGYAVTYDLLPAGKQLSPPIESEVGEWLTREIEAIVADDSLPTTEVSRSVSASLGHVSFFGREESARRVAATVSELVLDEANWVPARQPDGATGTNGAW